MLHRGGCHCGNLQIEFTSKKPPQELEVRECQCAFCRKHGTRAVADAEGFLLVKARDGGRLGRYRFGLRTADYLFCRDCGVYVAAVTRDDPAPRGIAIVNALDDRAAFSRTPVPSVYDHETESERRHRRLTLWTPARIETAEPG